MTAQTSDMVLERLMSLHPKIIDLSLDRMHRVLEALGNPERHLPPVIHVAGTNGKGSTQAMIRAGLEAAGRTVHAYTSPHLVRFHERIRLAGELISEPELIQWLDRCEAANEGREITYFEITTAAALAAFAEVQADWTLLEVGLGGRLDATNVVDQPALTIITPVSYDHQQYLGETLPEIAFEKAGIIKRGVPCVVAPQDEAAMEVIEAQATKLGAPLIAQGQHWHVFEERGRLIFQDETGLLDLPLPRLPGAHQYANAGAALAALRHIGASEAAYEAALTQAEWPARMQRLRRGPLVEAADGAELWLDGGHNPAAGEALADLLDTLPDRPTEVICGMLHTKDSAGFLAPLAGRIERLHGVTIPGESAALPAEDLVASAKAVGLEAVESASVEAAMADITTRTPGARVFICGSLYLAGWVLQENG